MNRNNPQPRVPTLKDLYGPKESSLPWEEHQAEIVRFWTDSGDCWGFLFHPSPELTIAPKNGVCSRHLWCAALGRAFLARFATPKNYPDEAVAGTAEI